MRIIRRVSAVAGLGLLVLLAQARAADAAEITVLCSSGLRAVMEELVPQFERATAHKVVIRFGLASVLKQQIEKGEPFDVAVLTPPLMDDLIKQGRIAGDTRTPVARAGLAVAIRAGARKRDIRTVDLFTRALLEAKSIAYAKEGASGVAFAALVQRLGLAEALKPKSMLTASGEAVGEAVARGEAELGVLPLSEILPVRGVDVLGTFPADVQSYIVMVAGVGGSANASRRGAARELISFITAPAALPVITAKGMERN